MAKDAISLKDIYEIVDRVETKMDERLKAIEADVSGLKSFRDKALGYVAGIGAVISISINLIWNELFKKG